MESGPLPFGPSSVDRTVFGGTLIGPALDGPRRSGERIRTARSAFGRPGPIGGPPSGFAGRSSPCGLSATHQDPPGPFPGGTLIGPGLPRSRQPPADWAGQGPRARWAHPCAAPPRHANRCLSCGGAPWGEPRGLQRGGPPTRPIWRPQPRAGQGPRARWAHPCAAPPQDQAGVPRDLRETQPPGPRAECDARPSTGPDGALPAARAPSIRSLLGGSEACRGG